MAQGIVDDIEGSAHPLTPVWNSPCRTHRVHQVHRFRRVRHVQSVALIVGPTLIPAVGGSMSVAAAFPFDVPINIGFENSQQGGPGVSVVRFPDGSGPDFHRWYLPPSKREFEENMLYKSKFRQIMRVDSGPDYPDGVGAVQRRRRVGGGWRQFSAEAMEEGAPGADPDRTAGPQGRQRTQRPQTTAARHDPSSAGSAWEFAIEGRRDDPDRIREQVRRGANIADAVGGGGGTLFTEPVLVVNQRAKLVKLAAEFAVYDQHGRPLGSVVQVGQSTTKKVARFIGRLDQFFTHTLEVRDTGGRVLLRLTRPAKVVKSRIEVEGGDGEPIGEIKQDNVLGAITFTLSADGVPVGKIRAENVLAWDFSVVDESDIEVARISKTWAGWGNAALTNADKYVVQIHRRLPGPLASLVVAASLSVDLALKQDDKGLSVSDLFPW